MLCPWILPSPDYLSSKSRAKQIRSGPVAAGLSTIATYTLSACFVGKLRINESKPTNSLNISIDPIPPSIISPFFLPLMLLRQSFLSHHIIRRTIMTASYTPIAIQHVNLAIPKDTLEQAQEFYGDVIGFKNDQVPQAQRDTLLW